MARLRARRVAGVLDLHQGLATVWLSLTRVASTFDRGFWPLDGVSKTRNARFNSSVPRPVNTPNLAAKGRVLASAGLRPDALEPARMGLRYPTLCPPGRQVAGRALRRCAAPAGREVLSCPRHAPPLRGPVLARPRARGRRHRDLPRRQQRLRPSWANHGLASVHSGRRPSSGRCLMRSIYVGARGSFGSRAALDHLDGVSKTNEEADLGRRSRRGSHHRSERVRRSDGRKHYRAFRAAVLR